jgi:hypothetical protein
MHWRESLYVTGNWSFQNRLQPLAYFHSAIKKGERGKTKREKTEREKERNGDIVKKGKRERKEKNEKRRKREKRQE